MKNKYTAAVFALFFGWTGAHRFYLGQSGMGVLYAASFLIGWFIPFLFILRFIPVIVGLIDAAAFLFMNEDQFDRRYNNDERSYDRRQRKGRRKDEPDFQRSAPSRDQYKKSVSQIKTKGGQKKNPFKLSGVRKFKEYDIKGALEDFIKGLEISPNDISLHFNTACAYSLLENAELGYYYLSKAIELGFNDLEKVKTHESLAYLRIQPQWQDFENSGYRLVQQLEAPKKDLLQEDQLLTQLSKLDELRKKGLITEEEFSIEKKKLMR